MANENAIQVSIQALEKITTENAALVTGAAETLTQAVAYAAAVEKIQTALTPEVMSRVFLPLKNRGKLGWRTDETDTRKYSLEQFRDAWTDALLRGALPINDEVCLIGGNVYLEKNHFKRKLRQFPGLTDLKLHPGKVEMKPSGVLIDMRLSCKINGKEVVLDRTGNSAIPVRLNSGQGADAGLGKAERKIMAQFYAQQTGSEITDGDDTSLEDLEVQTNGTAHIQQQQLQAPPEQQKTRTQQTAEALKAAREKNNDGQTAAPADDTVPWGKDEPASGNGGAVQPSTQAVTTTPAAQGSGASAAPAAKKKEKTVGWVKGSDGVTKAVTRPIVEATPAEATPPAATQPAQAAQTTAPAATATTPAAAKGPKIPQGPPPPEPVIPENADIKSEDGVVVESKREPIGTLDGQPVYVYKCAIADSTGVRTRFETRDLAKVQKASAYKQKTLNSDEDVKKGQPLIRPDAPPVTVQYVELKGRLILVDLIDQLTGEVLGEEGAAEGGDDVSTENP